jgi:hypothetical protein
MFPEWPCRIIACTLAALPAAGPLVTLRALEAME